MDEEPTTANIQNDNHVQSCRKRHCPFWLLNTLSSDEFVQESRSIGNIATARKLTEKDKLNQSSWTKVQQAFAHPHPVCGKLHFADDDKHLQGNIGIKTSKTEQHHQSKLRKICKMFKKDEKLQTTTTKSQEHMNQIAVSSVGASRTLAICKSCFSQDPN